MIVYLILAHFEFILAHCAPLVAFSKNDKNLTFGLESVFFLIISACVFNSINVCLYPLSIYNYI